MKNLKDVENEVRFCQEMRECTPSLTFDIECYHYYGSGGKDTSSKKITTYHSFVNIPIPYWCDYTPPLYVPNFQKLIHVKTKLITEWMHNSSETLEKIKSDLYNKNKSRDLFCTVKKCESVSGLIPEVMLLNGKKKNIPFLIRWPRYLLTFLGLGNQIAYHIATVSSVEEFRVIKKVSLEAPVVTPEFCAQYNIDYSKISAQAPILNSDNYITYTNNQNSETKGGASTVPCIINPAPLTISSDSDYQMYYNNMDFYDQIYQQQQQQQDQENLIQLEMINDYYEEDALHPKMLAYTYAETQEE